MLWRSFKFRFIGDFLAGEGRLWVFWCACRSVVDSSYRSLKNRKARTGRSSQRKLGHGCHIFRGSVRCLNLLRPVRKSRRGDAKQQSIHRRPSPSRTPQTGTFRFTSSYPFFLPDKYPIFLSYSQAFLLRQGTCRRLPYYLQKC